MAASFGRTQSCHEKGAAPMTSAPVRDPLADHLITPQNAAFLFIDYQPAQLAAVHSMDRDLLLKNAVSTVRTIKTFAVPVVHSTINVASGREQPTLPEFADVLTDDKPSTGPRSTPGRTSNSFRPSTPPAAASSSSAPCGPRSAWPSPRSTHCAKDMRCIPSSTRSAAPRPRPTEIVLTDRLLKEGGESHV